MKPEEIFTRQDYEVFKKLFNRELLKHKERGIHHFARDQYDDIIDQVNKEQINEVEGNIVRFSISIGEILLKEFSEIKKMKRFKNSKLFATGYQASWNPTAKIKFNLTWQ